MSCSSDIVPPLGRSYDSRPIQGDGIFVQMAIQPEENTFVEYISNREVDRGTIEENPDNIYLNGLKRIRGINMRKLEAINILSIITLAISFFYMIKIDNKSRLPANINTDYHMNSLPFIYLIIGSLVVMIIVALLRIRYLKKE